MNEFDSIRISIASPEKIRSWSYGEVTKPETINYRTFKPERDGLFCAKIFGPTTDWECLCGKFKRMKHRGVVCDKCGVEVTQSKVRRERMGHIELAAPVSHVWFFKGLPSRIGHLLDITLRDLERILYFEAYVVTDVKDEEEAGVKVGEMLSEDRYRELREEKGRDAFKATMGAEAIKELLAKVEIENLSVTLREKMKTETSQQKKLKFAKRLKVVEAFRKSGNRPEWMIMDVIPVIPPELRPLVPLDGGRFATSDLNDLYRRVINRNNRLKKLFELKAPEVIIRNEKRMLQEAVDALFDNGRRGRVLRGTNNRPLKSLSDTLKGKTGRFRQNLLGKRVDYSGRSVIVVGPDLKLHQCGLPKKMALELFKPFIYNKLEQAGLVSTIKAAKEMVEQERPEVWDYLEEVIKEHPVLLNRAPTLHRLGIQAFQPTLVEGKAIKIHPLVCTAFNADFDGDQMAVHVPLSPKAQIEAQVLMLSAQNLLSPANGSPIVVPTQDIVLGIYYLTKENPKAKGAGRSFVNADDVVLALEAGEVDLLAPIRLRYEGEIIDLETVRDKQDLLHTDIAVLGEETLGGDSGTRKLRDQITGRVALEDVVEPETGRVLVHATGLITKSLAAEIEKAKVLKVRVRIENSSILTTVGRVIFNSHLPAGLPYINGHLKKRGLSGLVTRCHLQFGNEKTVRLVDGLKDLGFYYASKAGISIGIEDMVIPGEKTRIVERAQKAQVQVQRQYLDGAITDNERYNKVIEIWSSATEAVSEAMFQDMEKQESEKGEFNPIFMMADSGARGSKQQMRQLAGMRGLMAKPSGDIIETPITSNFREGLTFLEYFISTHGARKGLADTALKTADSGYLTRRLVDVAQDVIVSELDCKTLDGIEVTAIVEGGETIEELRDRIVGRVALEDLRDPLNEDDVIVRANEEITESLANAIQMGGIERVKIRSVLTCESRRGVCVLCYGRNLATGRLVELGEAVGVIAAQSIGEPGTQLTMRTFHVGGVGQVSSESSIESKNGGVVKFLNNLPTVKNKEGELIAMSRNGSIVVQDPKGRELERHTVVYGANVKVADGTEVAPGAPLLQWDPYNSVILTEFGGTCLVRDVVEGVTMEMKTDDVTGFQKQVIIDSKDEKLQPRIEIRGPDEKVLKKYFLPRDAILNIEHEQAILPGDILVKIPRAAKKTKDITGGLPRVVELFEARQPKDPAKISEIDGVVRYGEVVKGKRKISVTGDDGETREYEIPKGSHITVQEGERVNAGDSLVEGPKNPHDILSVKGPRELQEYLVDEIQEVYRLQGVTINDKHIEVIVRQMMRWVKVEGVGDTDFIIDENVDRFRFREENERVLAQGGEPATGRPLLLGITKASLSTESFISAASFQETTRVLTEASINGKIDYLRGLKENVIMGRLIPAGTGMDIYRGIRIPPDETERQDLLLERQAETALDLSAALTSLREAGS
ncbi:MAG TPA: DNA-directed RNA polymerase subunit beta' [Candidatus Saccharimonadales bacterium]|nr:DNA-directed RNA polymerase subunit beta' [Candidatus Saccharimonadales bacterium]